MSRISRSICEKCHQTFEHNPMYPKTLMPIIRVATEIGYKLIRNPMLCKSCRGKLIHLLEAWWNQPKPFSNRQTVMEIMAENRRKR